MADGSRENLRITSKLNYWMERIPADLRIGALKAFADGSLGSGTAYFYEPFLNQGSNRGLLSDEMHPISLMRDRMMKADAAALQICTHAIGDEAISIAPIDLCYPPISQHARVGSRLIRQ